VNISASSLARSMAELILSGASREEVFVGRIPERAVKKKAETFSRACRLLQRTRPMTKERRDERESRSVMKVVGLFAGIGGLELGFTRAGGFEPVLMAEMDPFCQAVLRQRFCTSIVGDVRDIATLPRCDVLLAGFPCQPYSQAGRTLGWSSGGPHVREIFRLLDTSFEPPHVVLENVPFLVHLHHGEALRQILQGLEHRGYLWAYRIVDTSAFGIPQRRRRFILLASRTLNPAAILLEQDESAGPGDAGRANTIGFYWTEGNRGIGWAVNAVPPLKVGSALGIASPPAFWVKRSGGIYVPSIRGAELLQGFDMDWTSLEAPGIVPAKHRWRMVGNAVSVPVAEWLARRMLLAPDRKVPGTLLRHDSGLPKAAFFDGCGRQRAEVGVFPLLRPLPSLPAFLRRQYIPLSRSATRGFRQRYERSSLKKRAEFISALRSHEASVA